MTTLDIYGKTACISAFELILGLPLDRIKVELQHGTRKIQPVRPYLNYWYAGNVPSLIQRCTVYMPLIKITDKYCSDLPEYIKPFIVAGVISPYVSFFEGIKTAQQKDVWKFIDSTTKNKIPSMTNIINHIINDVGKPNLLFASIIPTYIREYCFVSGMLVIQPYMHKLLSRNQTFAAKQELNYPLSCLGASLICQTISQPIDVIKTRIELNPTHKLRHVITSMLTEHNTNIYDLRNIYYAGWLPRVIRGMWTFICMNYLINFI